MYVLCRCVHDGIKLEFLNCSALHNSIWSTIKIENIHSMASGNIQHLQNKAVPCYLCTRVYMSQYTLDVHVKQHVSPNKFQYTIFSVISAKTSAKQQNCKHIYNNSCFLWGPCQRFIGESEAHLQLDLCGGGVEYLHHDPASRRKRRKAKSQI
jgi:hypothetical protein